MIEQIFPESVLVEEFKDHNKYAEKLSKKCFELEKTTKKGGEGWLSKNTFNTMETWDLYYDKDFEPITKFIQEQVKVYCRYVGINIGSVPKIGRCSEACRAPDCFKGPYLMSLLVAPAVNKLYDLIYMILLFYKVLLDKLIMELTKNND